MVVYVRVCLYILCVCVCVCVCVCAHKFWIMEAHLAWGLSSLEIESVTGVLIRDEALCISFRANGLRNGINLILHYSYGKADWVFGYATSLGERDHWIKASSSPLKKWFCVTFFPWKRVLINTYIHKCWLLNYKMDYCKFIYCVHTPIMW